LICLKASNAQTHDILKVGLSAGNKTADISEGPVAEVTGSFLQDLEISGYYDCECPQWFRIESRLLYANSGHSPTNRRGVG
jgi:hypothetical protein